MALVDRYIRRLVDGLIQRNIFSCVNIIIVSDHGMADSPSGRLLVYDPIKQKSEVLQEEIHLANGIILSPNEDYVIFAESFQYRLLKHWIEGPKKGK